MTALAALRFIASAVRHRHAYIDMDRCLLMKFPMPHGVKDPLGYWAENLAPTPIVKSRLCLLYMLKLFGVKLHIWTNRWPQHEAVTRAALGRHMWLFDTINLLEGQKGEMFRLGPCMDDESKYLSTQFHDLLVRPK